MQRTDPTDLAAQSLALYQALRDELRRLLSEAGAAETDSILAMDERMASLRQAIQEADAALMALPSRPEAESGRMAALLAKRRHVMDEVLSLHKKAIAQAESIKSLLAHDLAAMRTGRQVLNGYAPPGQDGSGSIINRQS